MSIFETPYNTTVGKAIVIRSTDHAIREALIKGLTSEPEFGLIQSENLIPLFVSGIVSDVEENIPFFAHPMLIENFKGMNYLCADVRSCVTKERPVRIKNSTEYNYAKSRLLLSAAWVINSKTMSTNNLKLSLAFAGTVFSAWISNLTAKRFALNPHEEMVLAIIAHYYFQSLHFDNDKIDEYQIQAFGVQTLKSVKTRPETVFEVFDKIREIAGEREFGIAVFCECVRKIIENVRLSDFNPGTLISSMTSSWFGSNAAETLAISLEHPPTWYAIIYSALTDKSYKNSLVGRITDNYNRGGVGDAYLKSYASLVSDFNAPADKRVTLLDFKDFED